MAYDEGLAERIRDVVTGEPGVAEKRMFGGLAFLVDGALACSASSQGGLMVRVDPAETEALAGRPHVRRFEMRGRSVPGWLRVDPEALTGDEELRGWVQRGLDHARSVGGA